MSAEGVTLMETAQQVLTAFQMDFAPQLAMIGMPRGTVLLIDAIIPSLVLALPFASFVSARNEGALLTAIENMPGGECVRGVYKTIEPQLVDKLWQYLDFFFMVVAETQKQ